jgi:hypothetical protein
MAGDDGHDVVEPDDGLLKERPPLTPTVSDPMVDDYRDVLAEPGRFDRLWFNEWRHKFTEEPPSAQSLILWMRSGTPARESFVYRELARHFAAKKRRRQRLLDRLRNG